MHSLQQVLFMWVFGKFDKEWWVEAQHLKVCLAQKCVCSLHSRERGKEPTVPFCANIRLLIKHILLGGLGFRLHTCNGCHILLPHTCTTTCQPDFPLKKVGQSYCTTTHNHSGICSREDMCTTCNISFGTISLWNSLYYTHSNQKSQVSSKVLWLRVVTTSCHIQVNFVHMCL